MIGVRGKAPKVSNSVSSVLETQRTKHSQKPEEAREKIIEFCGDIPRIELFSRESSKKTNGWINVGYEISGKDISEDLDKIIKGKY